MEAKPELTELDCRQNDGMIVQLLWNRDSNQTLIRVEDEKAGHTIQYAVLGEKALEAFNHPFVFAPAES